MRALPALIACALLGATALACGGATKAASSTSPVPAGAGSTGGAITRDSTPSVRSGGYLREDGDKDGDEGSHSTNPGQDDQSLLATYRDRASPAEARTIAALVKRYYAASVAGDGSRACTLLFAGLARGLAAQGTSACAAALSPLLAQQHQHLVAEDPATMVVTSVRVKSDLGVAVLGFRSAPESDIVIEREGHIWRIGALFDNNMP